MEYLCIKSVVPFPGFAVRLTFPRVMMSFDSPRVPTELSATKLHTTFSQLFRQNSIEESLPKSAFSLLACLDLLGARLLVELLYHALVEGKILFHSSNTAILPAIGEAIRTLLYPWRWGHVYIPVMPCVLMDVVEAPVPFIVGLSTSTYQALEKAALVGVVVVDCNLRTISKETSAEERFPAADLDRWCVLALKCIFSAYKTKTKTNNDSDCEENLYLHSPSI
jgi:hypothetical protein